MELSKRKIFAIGGAVICTVGVVLAAGSVQKTTKPASAVPFNQAGAQGNRMLAQIKAPVDLNPQLKGGEAYIPIEVRRAFIDGGGCARVIVHNNTNTPIVAYDLDIIYFDEKGMPTGDKGSFTVNNIILSANQDIGIDKYVGGSEGGTYINAIVKKALYYDGTAWENDDLEAELAIKEASFNIEEFQKSIEKNQDNVKKASENAHIFINEMTMANADQISGRRDLKLVLTNTSNRTIKDIKVAVAELDKDNKPVDTSPQIYIGKNVRLAVCKGMELKVGESRAFSSSGFLEKDCYRINAIVTEITFSDGIVWKNPYAIDWLLWFM